MSAPAGIHLARSARHRAAGEIAAGLVARRGRGLMGNTAGGPRPMRVEALADFLTEKLALRSKRGTRFARTSTSRPPSEAKHELTGRD
jgi:hypothetical protein